jgi:ZIP family zinc transporter
MSGGVVPALLLSTMAGLSTAVGSLIAMFSKRDDTRFLSLSLGFSAGVMVTVSFAELLPEAQENLCAAYGARGAVLALLSLTAGIAAAAIIDLAIPEHGAGHGVERKVKVNAQGNQSSASAAMMHMGIVTAVAITVHNFPEGIATFMAGYADIRIGLPVALLQCIIFRRASRLLCRYIMAQAVSRRRFGIQHCRVCPNHLAQCLPFCVLRRLWARQRLVVFLVLLRA